MSATDTVEIKYTIEPLAWHHTSATDIECWKAKMPHGYVTVRKGPYGTTLQTSSSIIFRPCDTVEQAKKIAYGLYIQQLLPFLKEHNGDVQDQTLALDEN